jgi:zeaxanthin glucosyltransferase
MRCQALDRERDLLWQPEQVAVEVARLCDELEPERVIVDHVSFASTLAMYATGRPFDTLVPGHPASSPSGRSATAFPPSGRAGSTPIPDELAELEQLVDRVTGVFTERWNAALAAVAPDRPPVDDAFRVHGDVVLYNSVPELHAPTRTTMLPEPAPLRRSAGPPRAAPG